MSQTNFHREMHDKAIDVIRLRNNIAHRLSELLKYFTYHKVFTLENVPDFILNDVDEIVGLHTKAENAANEELAKRITLQRCGICD